MAFRLDSLPIGYWYRWEIRLGCGRGQAAILSQALLQLPVSNWPRNAKWRGILLDCSRTCLYSSFAILISSCNSINLCAYTQSLWMSAALCFDSPCPRMEREIVVMYPFRAVSGPRSPSMRCWISFDLLMMSATKVSIAAEICPLAHQSYWAST